MGQRIYMELQEHTLISTSFALWKIVKYVKWIVINLN